jgi:L-lactate dehydrogenase
MKVVVIGCGNVGMSYAYSLVNNSSRVSELVLIDIDEQKAVGEALDLNHALPFAEASMSVRAGNYSDCNDADLICISAGRNQDPGETRLDLINKNLEVFKSVIGSVKKTKFNGIYLIATNPVDIMSYVTYKLSGNHKKVIGSGTTLDTARLKYLLGRILNINPKNVHAYVIGEHGDSEMIPWSQATVGLKDISEYLDVEQMEHIKINVRDSAYEIIEKKGSTCYGIGVVLAKITNSIFNNDNSLLTLSTYNKEHNIYISTPTIMTSDGVRETIDITLSKKEQKEYQHSIDVVKEVVEKLDL